MKSNLLKARKLQIEVKNFNDVKRNEIANLEEPFFWKPKFAMEKAAFTAYINDDKFYFSIDKFTSISNDDLGEFFDYIDKVKQEYQNFLGDKREKC